MSARTSSWIALVCNLIALIWGGVVTFTIFVVVFVYVIIAIEKLQHDCLCSPLASYTCCYQLIHVGGWGFTSYTEYLNRQINEVHAGFFKCSISCTCTLLLNHTSTFPILCKKKEESTMYFYSHKRTGYCIATCKINVRILQMKFYGSQLPRRYSSLCPPE